MYFKIKEHLIPAPSTTASTGVTELISEFAQRAKAAWARLIRKVYEAEPLECPKCRSVKNGPMHVIALESRMRQSSVASSSTWACGRRGRCNAVRHKVPEAWPVHATSLPLTYHPAPDIA